MSKQIAILVFSAVAIIILGGKLLRWAQIGPFEGGSRTLHEGREISSPVYRSAHENDGAALERQFKAIFSKTKKDCLVVNVSVYFDPRIVKVDSVDGLRTFVPDLAGLEPALLSGLAPSENPALRASPYLQKYDIQLSKTHRGASVEAVISPVLAIVANADADIISEEPIKYTEPTAVREFGFIVGSKLKDDPIHRRLVDLEEYLPEEIKGQSFVGLLATLSDREKMESLFRLRPPVDTGSEYRLQLERVFEDKYKNRLLYLPQSVTVNGEDLPVSRFSSSTDWLIRRSGEAGITYYTIEKAEPSNTPSVHYDESRKESGSESSTDPDASGT